MAKPTKSPPKGKVSIFVNLLLLLLVTTAVWFFYTNQSPSSSDQAVTNSAQKIPANTSNRDIQVIRAQLELEKARAEKVRTEIRLRGTQQNTLTAPPAPAGAGLDTNEQKLRIAEMISAQLQGSQIKIQQPNTTLKKKEQEVAAINAQNTQRQGKIKSLDNSTQSILSALQGQDISASDQDYITALQGGGDTRSTTSDVDLINRIEISDAKDNSDTALLRSRIQQLMEKDRAPQTKAVQSPAGQKSRDLQSNIDALMAQRSERAEASTAEKQFQADIDYLESLNPMEEERSNETRWVTVRSGDTLSIIAQRVYNDSSLYTRIYDANPQVLSNPDLIRAGQKLRVPR